MITLTITKTKTVKITVMKKKYMKPEMLLEELELEQMIALSTIEDGEADPNEPVLSRELDIFFDDND